MLGDIVIQELNVGNSLPVLSNPKLVNISVDGDMLIEMDIDYTGGVRLVLATEATLSVPAWDAYMRPITVPVTVAVKIKRFSARVLFKIKPFWESNRIWFGFYRQPELKLELEVEPIISNKLIKIQMVNQVIERRIKESLEAYVMLPAMDDLSFWDFTDLNGSPFGEKEEEEEEEEELNDSIGESEVSETGTMRENKIIGSPNLVIGAIPNDVYEPSPTKDVSPNDVYEPSSDKALDASLVGEAFETSFRQSSTLRHRRKNSITRYIESVEKHLLEFQHPDLGPEFEDEVYHDTEGERTNSFGENDSEISEVHSDYVEYLGNAAFSLGQISRHLATQYGLSETAQTIATSVVDYTKPAVKFAKETTETYKAVVQQQAAIVGLTAIEKLGLSPEKKHIADTHSDVAKTSAELMNDIVPPSSSGPKTLRQKTSTTWSVLGLSISTSAPVLVPTLSPQGNRKRVLQRRGSTKISIQSLSGNSGDDSLTRSEDSVHDIFQ